MAQPNAILESNIPGITIGDVPNAGPDPGRDTGGLPPAAAEVAAAYAEGQLASEQDATTSVLGVAGVAAQASTNFSPNPNSAFTRAMLASADWTVTRVAARTDAIPAFTGGWMDKHVYGGAFTQPDMGFVVINFPFPGWWVVSRYIWIPAGFDGSAPWMDATSLVDSEGESHNLADLTKRGQWQRIWSRVKVAPADLVATYQIIQFTPPSSQATGAFYSDAMQIEPSNDPFQGAFGIGAPFKLHDQFVDDPDSNALVTADTGQTYLWYLAQMGVRSGYAQNLGPGNTYEFINLGGISVARVGIRFRYEQAGDTIAFGVWQQDMNTADPANSHIPDSPCHCTMGQNGNFQVSVIENFGTEGLTPIGSLILPELELDTDYECEVVIVGQELAVILPEGSVVGGSHPFVSSKMGPFPFCEMTNGLANTAKISEWWADDTLAGTIGQGGQPTTYRDSSSGLSGSKSVRPWSGARVALQGTWTPTLPAASYIGGTYLSNTTAAVNDEVAYDLDFSEPGTYEITFYAGKVSSNGIISVRVDGIEVGTFDGYAAAAVPANPVTISNVVIGSAATHRISLAMASKNAASTGYSAEIHGDLALRRTA